MARDKNLTEFEKLRIIHCYEQDTPAARVALVLGRNAATFRSFYSRYISIIGLPPKDKLLRPPMPAFIGLKLKELARSTMNVGVRKMALILKQEYPEAPWHPFYQTCANYLKKKGFSTS